MTQSQSSNYGTARRSLWTALACLLAVVILVTAWLPGLQADWSRAAILMLRRYGDKALEETATRADQLDTEGDPDGAATWRWIARAIEQLANTKPPGGGQPKTPGI